MRVSILDTLMSPQATDPALNEGYWTDVWNAGVTSAAGIRVSADSAMRVSAVYRSVSILANALGMLPGGVYQRLGRGREEIQGHPVYQLLWRRPNPYQLPFEFKRVMLAWAVLRGVAFAKIYRSSGGELELWPLHPDRISGPELKDSGNRVYTYTRPDNGRQEKLFADVDLLVVNGLSLDGIRGLAMSDLARDSIGLASATEQYGAQLFAKGARFSGMIKLPPGRTITSPEARAELRKKFSEQGAGPGQWWGIPIGEDGMEWQNISMSNDDAQFLETRKFTLSDIARWFGIPPHMIGDVERSTSWGTGIEQQSIQFVTYALMPWLTLFEQAFSAFMVRDEYLRFNVEGLLRADAKTRHEIYAIGTSIGMYSPNECREKEERNPREGGDVWVTPTAPQQSAGSTSESSSDDGDEDDDGDGKASIRAFAERIAALETMSSDSLLVRIDEIEKSLAEPGIRKLTRAEVLETLRLSAVSLGIPTPEIRKVIAKAKPKEEGD